MEDPLTLFERMTVTLVGANPSGMMANANLGMQYLPEFLDATGGYPLFAQPIGAVNRFCGTSFGGSSHGRGYRAGFF